MKAKIWLNNARKDQVLGGSNSDGGLAVQKR